MKNSINLLNMKNLFNEDYYERGQELGLSGYTDYRWIPDLTIPFAQKTIEYLSLKKEDKILEFGCAKGFFVKALRDLGYCSYGVDISEYAIKNAPKDVQKYLYHSEEMVEGDRYDWIIAKDVLEHVPHRLLSNQIKEFSKICNKIFVIVPLGDGENYIIPEYESDITHYIREDENFWIRKFYKEGFSLKKFDNIVPGMKDNWAHYENGNGFFVFENQKEII